MSRPIRKHVLAMIVCVALAASQWGSVSAFAAQNRSGAPNPTLTIVGSPESGGSGGGLVDGIAPPSVDGDLPAGAVILRINGWTYDDPELQWNEEEQAWSFKFDLPLDSAGAVVTITVTTATGVATHTFKITS